MGAKWQIGARGGQVGAREDKFLIACKSDDEEDSSAQNRGLFDASISPDSGQSEFTGVRLPGAKCFLSGLLKCLCGLGLGAAAGFAIPDSWPC